MLLHTSVRALPGQKQELGPLYAYLRDNGLHSSECAHSRLRSLLLPTSAEASAGLIAAYISGALHTAAQTSTARITTAHIENSKALAAGIALGQTDV